ncbi:MAG: AI-2E family transporter [Myxococcaceae bacterium]|nr:AI-2E family transporter [Myxococcaceae bacterium]
MSIDSETRHSQVSPRTIWTIGLNVILMVGTLVVIREAWTVISWILIALFIALALDPLVSWLHSRFAMKRGIAVLIVFVVAWGLVAIMVAKFTPILVEQGKRLSESVPDLLERLRRSRAWDWLDGHFHLSGNAERAVGHLTAGPAVAVAGRIFRGLAGTVTITSLTIFMLLFGGDLFSAFLSWFEPIHRQRIRILARRMHHRVGGYVSGTLLIAAIGGGVIGTTLAILGNPFFLPLGLLMIVLGVIPWLGSALGAILVTGTTFAAQGPKQAVIVLGIYLVYQQVEIHVLQPVVQRRTIEMNPLLIAVVMLVGTSITGLLGTLIALPVAGAAQVVLQDLRRRRRGQWEAVQRQRRREDDRQLQLFDRDDRESSLRH